MTLTIVSGAAPGVEQGAIEAAVNLALRWTGVAPREYIASLMLRPVYTTGLSATSATDPGMVRRLNIQAADGALVFSTSMVLAGVAAFVDKWTERMGRAFLHVTLNPAALRSPLPAAVVSHVQSWVRDNELARVYVTGPSDEDVPGIQGAVRDALIAILEPFAVDEVNQVTRTLRLVEQNFALLDKHQVHGAQVPDIEPARVTLGLPGDDLSAPVTVQTASLHRKMLAGEVRLDQAVLPVSVTSPDAFERELDAPTDCRGEPLDLAEAIKPRGRPCRCMFCGETVLYDLELSANLNGATGCGASPHGLHVGDPFGPATRADIEDLDAVPEPIDSAAPAMTHLPGAAPIGPSAQTRPYSMRPAPPEGLDEIQRAQLDASVREAERDVLGHSCEDHPENCNDH